MSKLDQLLETACKGTSSAPEPSSGMLAHLSRRRRLSAYERAHYPNLRGRQWYQIPLRFSGYGACGDEFNAPVDVVIDVGKPFWINSEGKLYVVPGGAELRPEKLLRYARVGY